MLSSLLFACPAVCHVLMHDICFEGQNAEKKDFPVECCLLAFNIVALGPVVSLELFVSRAYVASYHGYHIYPRLVFLRRSHSFTSRKLHVSLERFLCFVHQFG